jgi:nucleoid-associated protein YgaU
MNYRYRQSSKQANKGASKFETTHFQAAKPTNNDIWIIAKKYDRLDLMAHKYYGDRNLWWIIAVANELVNGSLVVPTGKRIRIPHKEKGFMDAIDKSTFDIQSNSRQGLPDGLGGGAY